MTRAVVFFTAVMAAASLGLFAQDSSRSPSNSPSASSSQASTQTATTQGEASTSSSAATVAAQRTNAPQGGATPAPTAGKGTATQSGGSVANSVDVANGNGQLPQTSTILPLLGLIGLGSLVAGLFARR
jgi:hypothetical protein